MKLVWKKNSEVFSSRKKGACHRCSCKNTSGCDGFGSKKVTEVRSGQYLDVKPPRESKMLQGIVTLTPWRWHAALGAPGGGRKSKSGMSYCSFVCAAYQRRQVLTNCPHSKRNETVIISSGMGRLVEKTTQTQEITKQNKQKHNTQETLRKTSRNKENHLKKQT